MSHLIYLPSSFWLPRFGQRNPSCPPNLRIRSIEKIIIPSFIVAIEEYSFFHSDLGLLSFSKVSSISA